MNEIMPSGSFLPFNNKDSKFPNAPIPFERDIFLFKTHIAGTTHIENIYEIEKDLKIKDKLNFYREPKNPYDSGAIIIKTKDKVKIGYVPQKDNIIFARLMDAGKLLFGEIKTKETIGEWVKIEIKIYLHE